MKNKLFSSLVFVLGLSLVSCSDSPFRSPTSPSRGGPDVPGERTSSDVKDWSPYIGIHTTYEAEGAYKEVVKLLKQNGKILGARVGFSRGENFHNRVISMLNDEGVKLLGIVDNFYLIYDGENIERKIDEIIRVYPYVKYLQIGNEYTTIVFQGDSSLRKDDPRVTTEYYMKVFNRIYNHVTRNYPDITLLTYSILGSGQRGPDELEKMFNLGLRNMDRQKVIVAINCYSAGDASLYSGTLNRLGRYRVWVTESGYDNPDRHLDHVKYEYPAIKNILRAERIYWYVLWERTSFRLIDDFPDSQSPARWFSPLFKALISQGGE